MVPQVTKRRLRVTTTTPTMHSMAGRPICRYHHNLWLIPVVLLRVIIQILMYPCCRRLLHRVIITYLCHRLNICKRMSLQCLHIITHHTRHHIPIYPQLTAAACPSRTTPLIINTISTMIFLWATKTQIQSSKSCQKCLQLPYKREMYWRLCHRML